MATPAISSPAARIDPAMIIRLRRSFACWRRSASSRCDWRSAFSSRCVLDMSSLEDTERAGAGCAYPHARIRKRAGAVCDGSRRTRATTRGCARVARTSLQPARPKLKLRHETARGFAGHAYPAVTLTGLWSAAPVICALVALPETTFGCGPREALLTPAVKVITRVTPLNPPAGMLNGPHCGVVVPTDGCRREATPFPPTTMLLVP